MPSSRSLLPLAACAALMAAPLAAAQTVFPLAAKAAFLHVNSDPASNTAPIALAPLAVQGGDCARLRILGDFDFGPGGDTSVSTLGVFSADATLLGPSLLHRVPGALEAGIDYATITTFFGNQPTDIAEDFVVGTDAPGGGEVTVEVPAGAAYLFVCANDHYFSDNSDPDADFRVEITKVGCWKDLGLGLAGVNGTPALAGSGALLGGDAMALSLSSAKPLSSAALVVGFGQLNAPFKGGTLVPTLNGLIAGLPTDGAGALLLPTTWPAGLPSDFSLYFQAWIADAAGPHGLSASNGLSATTP